MLASPRRPAGSARPHLLDGEAGIQVAEQGVDQVAGGVPEDDLVVARTRWTGASVRMSLTSPPGRPGWRP